MLYIFLTIQSNSFDDCVHYYNVEILNLFDRTLQPINSKTVTKSKLKEFLGELKVQTIIVLDYKKRNNRKIFHSSTKLVANCCEKKLC